MTQYQSQPPTTRTAAAQLRAALDDVERQIVVMHETPDGVVSVIRETDRINQLVGELQQQGIDVRAEEGRATALSARLQREHARVERLVAANGQGAQLDDSPTWQAVRAAGAAHSASRTRKILLVSGIIAVIAVIVLVIIPWLYPPVQTAQLDTTQRLAQQNDFAGALAAARAEQARVPTDPESWLWIGALEQKLGNQAAAEQAWNTARAQYPDIKTFLMGRGLVLSLLAENQQAEADAQALIREPGGAAQGHYLLGSIREMSGDMQGAVSELQQAANLADEAKNDSLAVMARTRMGLLLQQMQVPTLKP